MRVLLREWRGGKPGGRCSACGLLWKLIEGGHRFGGREGGGDPTVMLPLGRLLWRIQAMKLSLEGIGLGGSRHPDGSALIGCEFAAHATEAKPLTGFRPLGKPLTCSSVSGAMPLAQQVMTVASPNGVMQQPCLEKAPILESLFQLGTLGPRIITSQGYLVSQIGPPGIHLSPRWSSSMNPNQCFAAGTTLETLIALHAVSRLALV